MAVTDLKSIIDAWQLVLEASPVSLVRAQQAFSHDRQPNANIQDTYWIDDGGAVNRRSVTNHQEVRVDRLVVMVAKPISFVGLDQFEAMEQLGDTIYRQLSADGRTNGWNVEADTRRITHPPKTELIVASFGFRVDYDFDANAT